MNEAHRRGLRVITELVINHTSDQHPWFRRARRSRPGSDARNWYVWSDSDQKYTGTRIIFRDTEHSNWAWDAEAGAFYWHRFFSHQPDLNFDNPRVQWAMISVMRRWLDMGVDGFRLDAIPYLCEREGTNNENLAETHEVIKVIRRELDGYSPGKLLLAEANQWPEDVNATWPTTFHSCRVSIWRLLRRTDFRSPTFSGRRQKSPTIANGPSSCGTTTS
jgi:maltose alpha-D-glucosyltransferase/alpha-amylase